MALVEDVSECTSHLVLVHLSKRLFVHCDAMMKDAYTFAMRPLHDILAVIVVGEVYDAFKVEALEKAKVALVRMPTAVHTWCYHVKIQRRHHRLGRRRARNMTQRPHALGDHNIAYLHGGVWLRSRANAFRSQRSGRGGCVSNQRMAQRPGPSSGRVGEGGSQRRIPLPGISSTASALRSRRNETRVWPYTDEIDDFEVETPGDAALHELPSGIIMPGVKSARMSQANASAANAAGEVPKSQPGRVTALKTGAMWASRAPPPKLPGSKPGFQFKGTPMRVPRYSLPVRAEKPVRASKVTGRHVLLPSESQLAPMAMAEKPNKAGEEEEDDEEDEEDEENENDVSQQPWEQRKGPVYYTFERMPPLTRATTELPRLTSYAVSTSLNLRAVLAFLRREHGVRPRLYEGCVYALYFKPLLPGFGRASVRSSRAPQTGSPGQESRHEREIQRDEESGYVGDYFVPQEEQEMDTNGYIPDEHQAMDAPAPQASVAEPSDPDSAGARDMLLADEADERHESQHRRRRRRVVRINEASHTHAAEPNEHAPQSIKDALDMAELVLLPYGVLVMFNFTQEEEELVIADIMQSGAIRNPHKMYDRELFHFCYDPNVRAPRIHNDFFTFREPNHLLKLSLAHAIAQSTKLSEFEESMHKTLELTSHIPRELAQTGELRVSRRGALRMSGHLFKLRVDVNLTSDVLDTPDLFWDEASLQALYDAIRAYLEIDDRAQTLNERLAVANELLEVIHEHFSNAAMSKITWIIIILIVVACIVAVGEISARLILHAR